jgi:hypothetical protein
MVERVDEFAVRLTRRKKYTKQGDAMYTITGDQMAHALKKRLESELNQWGVEVQVLCTRTAYEG